MTTRPRAADPVIRKADLQTLRTFLQEDAIVSEVCGIASDVLDAANALLTSITYDLGPTSKQGKWHAYAHNQYTNQITWYYSPTPDEFLSRLRVKFPDSTLTVTETDGRVSVTVDWS